MQHPTQALSPLPLFAPARLAHKPYCANELEAGLRIRSVDTALTRAYIQANCPGKQFRIVVDVDHDIRPTAGTGEWHGDFGVPMPNWTAISPETGRAHVGYEIDVPVSKHMHARSAPIRYAAAVEGGLVRKLRGDPGYTGLVCKNPLHPKWKLVPGRRDPYELGELADWLDSATPVDRKLDLDASSLGRNCMLFDQLRRWAYVRCHSFRKDRSFGDWLMAVEKQACALNQFHGTCLARTDPLAWAELRRIAKSVAGWTWKHLGTGAAHDAFVQTQRRRAELAASAKRARTEEKIGAAKEALAAAGCPVTLRAVARFIGMSPSGLSQHYRHLFGGAE